MIQFTNIDTDIAIDQPIARTVIINSRITGVSTSKLSRKKLTRFVSPRGSLDDIYKYPEYFSSGGSYFPVIHLTEYYRSTCITPPGSARNPKRTRRDPGAPPDSARRPPRLCVVAPRLDRGGLVSPPWAVATVPALSLRPCKLSQVIKPLTPLFGVRLSR